MLLIHSWESEVKKKPVGFLSLALGRIVPIWDIWDHEAIVQPFVVGSGQALRGWSVRRSSCSTVVVPARCSQGYARQ